MKTININLKGCIEPSCRPFLIDKDLSLKQQITDIVSLNNVEFNDKFDPIITLDLWDNNWLSPPYLYLVTDNGTVIMLSRCIDLPASMFAGICEGDTISFIYPNAKLDDDSTHVDLKVNFTCEQRSCWATDGKPFEEVFNRITKNLFITSTKHLNKFSTSSYNQPCDDIPEDVKSEKSGTHNHFFKSFLDELDASVERLRKEKSAKILEDTPKEVEGFEKIRKIVRNNIGNFEKDENSEANRKIAIGAGLVICGVAIVAAYLLSE